MCCRLNARVIMALFVLLLMTIAPLSAYCAEDGDMSRDDRARFGAYIEMTRQALDVYFNASKYCAGGAVGDGAASVAGPPMCAFLAVAREFYESLVIYVAATGFVLLLLWYFFSYVLRMYRGDESGMAYFTKRALLLLAAFVLLVPASVVGIDDHRPVSMWAISKGVEAGMELIGDGLTRIGNSAGGAYADMIAVGKGDPISVYLALPLTVEQYMEQADQKVRELAQKAERTFADPEEGGRFQSLWRNIRRAISNGSIKGTLLGIGMGAIGVLIGILSGGTLLLPAVTLTLTGAGVTMSGLGHWDLIKATRDSLVEPVFTITLSFAFYGAVVMMVVRSAIYGALAPVAALLFPMGRWGMQRLPSYFANLAAFLLTPFVIAGGWFLGLFVRALYMVVSELMLMVFRTLVMDTYLGGLIMLIAAWVLSVFFILPVAYIMLRAPSYLAHILGQVFSAGMGIAERLRAPMAR